MRELTLDELDMVAGGANGLEVAGGAVLVVAGSAGLFALVPGPQSAAFAGIAAGLGFVGGAMVLVGAVLPGKDQHTKLNAS